MIVVVCGGRPRGDGMWHGRGKGGPRGMASRESVAWREAPGRLERTGGCVWCVGRVGDRGLGRAIEASESGIGSDPSRRSYPLPPAHESKSTSQSTSILVARSIRIRVLHPIPRPSFLFRHSAGCPMGPGIQCVLRKIAR